MWFQFYCAISCVGFELNFSVSCLCLSLLLFYFKHVLLLCLVLLSLRPFAFSPPFVITLVCYSSVLFTSHSVFRPTCSAFVCVSLSSKCPMVLVGHMSCISVFSHQPSDWFC